MSELHYIVCVSGFYFYCQQLLSGLFYCPSQAPILQFVLTIIIFKSNKYFDQPQQYLNVLISPAVVLVQTVSTVTSTNMFHVLFMNLSPYPISLKLRINIDSCLHFRVPTWPPGRMTTYKVRLANSSENILFRVILGTILILLSPNNSGGKMQSSHSTIISIISIKSTIYTSYRP